VSRFKPLCRSKGASGRNALRSGARVCKEVWREAI
jgi:hypothetical protein